VLYSVTDRSSFRYAQTCLQELRPAKRLNAVILVANKSDVVRNRLVSTAGAPSASQFPGPRSRVNNQVVQRAHSLPLYIWRNFRSFRRPQKAKLPMFQVTSKFTSAKKLTIRRNFGTKTYENVQNSRSYAMNLSSGCNTAVIRELAQSGEQWQSPVMTTLMLSRLQWVVGQAQWSDLRGDDTFGFNFQLQRLQVAV